MTKFEWTRDEKSTDYPTATTMDFLVWTRETEQEARHAASIPCGWCDTDVIVSDDHGQVVYCSESHKQANVYVPNVEGNI